ncbi:MAG: transglycosylase domain-containing protein [Lachnospiraceae bacterium]|jgi:penicillin-binding protein 1A|nr:transglycosylase domain-containing protein [Lachnospiraceae bacterium]
MNYGKRGIRAKQKHLHALGKKWGKKFTLNVFSLIIMAILAIGIIAASAGFGVFQGVIDTAPDVSDISVIPIGYSSFAFDREGNQIAKLVATNSNRIPVGRDVIPQHLADAFVSIEDERFYEHNGIDIKGIIRAAYVGLTSGIFSEGASTITQQLLKNTVFTDWTGETTMAEKAKRKIQEQYLALETEKIHHKADILVNYMNSINLGQNTLGVQAASLRYFNKPVNELTISESAVIASITQNPTRFNPISNPEENEGRRRRVLGNMLEQGYITQIEYDIAIADDVYARIQIIDEQVDSEAANSYFVDALIDEVLHDLLAAGYSDSTAYYLLYSGGLKIHTTQDPHIQRISDEVFANEENYPPNVKWLLNYELTITTAGGERKNHSTEMFRLFFLETNRGFNLIFDSQEAAHEAIENYKEAVMDDGDEVLAERINLTAQPQVSLIVADQYTGEVLAMIGGRGQKTASRTLNRAVSTRRQPGSTFKTVAVYAPALDSAGMTLASVQKDAPFNYPDGRPVNNWWSSSVGYKGLASYRSALQESMNIIAVKTLTQISPQLGFEYLLNFGFTTLVERMEVGGLILSDIVPSLALGGITIGVTNLEMNASYATIANGGVYVRPRLYTRVYDYDGNILLDNTTPETRQVLKESTAFLLTDAMADVFVAPGTGTAARFPGMALAGKTGSTTGYNDVWFAGYSPYYTATVWTGFDNNVDMRGDSERGTSRRLWRLVMERVHEDLPYRDFPIPSDIVTETICSRSGKLPLPGLCVQKETLRSEYFAVGTVPTDFCNAHYQGIICQYWLLPASPSCPFQIPGVIDIDPPEDPSLWAGSGSAAVLVGEGYIHEEVLNDDGTISLQIIPQVNIVMCPHDWDFFLDSDVANEIIARERAEIEAVIRANAQAQALSN